MGPLPHARDAKSPTASTRPAEHVTHQNAERGACSIESIRLVLSIAGLRQPGIEEGHRMALTAEVPGGTGTNGAGTDDGNGTIQLRASAGITSA